MTEKKKCAGRLLSGGGVNTARRRRDRRERPRLEEKTGGQCNSSGAFVGLLIALITWEFQHAKIEQEPQQHESQPQTDDQHENHRAVPMSLTGLSSRNVFAVSSHHGAFLARSI